MRLYLFQAVVTCAMESNSEHVLEIAMDIDKSGGFLKTATDELFSTEVTTTISPETTLTRTNFLISG